MQMKMTLIQLKQFTHVPINSCSLYKRPAHTSGFMPYLLRRRDLTLEEGVDAISPWLNAEHSVLRQPQASMWV